MRPTASSGLGVIRTRPRRSRTAPKIAAAPSTCHASTANGWSPNGPRNSIWRASGKLGSVKASRSLTHALAQDPRRPEDQHQDEEGEGESVLVGRGEESAAEVGDVSRSQRLGQAE